MILFGNFSSKFESILAKLQETLPQVVMCYMHNKRAFRPWWTDKNKSLKMNMLRKPGV